ncbi:hypothetical protein [Peribacillus simplex]|uniref:hypothetical protein n=1 Tax=Peribacillus simplex TaxID=1478 RepID=UPI003D2B766A
MPEVRLLTSDKLDMLVTVVSDSISAAIVLFPINKLFTSFIIYFSIYYKNVFDLFYLYMH